MNVGKITFGQSPRTWDSVARCYVEHDTTAQETFGELAYPPDGGLREPVRSIDETFSGMKMVHDHFFRGNRMPSESIVIKAGQFIVTDAKDIPGNSVLNANDNRGPYISTYTGRFYMFDPRPDDWCIADVAHALAHICRYTGAGANRYSVAEHSVHVYRWLTAQGHTPAVRLAGLMHDAPEALSGFGDVARPSKKHAPIIGETEDNIWRLAIAPAFGLPAEMPEAVHEADMRICADEMEQNLHEVDPNVGPPLGITLEYWEPVRAEAEFLRAFHTVQLRAQSRRVG